MLEGILERYEVKKKTDLQQGNFCKILFDISSLAGHHRKFEVIANYCKYYSDLAPLSFLLGFYVHIAVTRWWEMFQSIPSTDTLALLMSNSFHSQVNGK